MAYGDYSKQVYTVEQRPGHVPPYNAATAYQVGYADPSTGYVDEASLYASAPVANYPAYATPAMPTTGYGYAPPPAYPAYGGGYGMGYGAGYGAQGGLMGLLNQRVFGLPLPIAAIAAYVVYKMVKKSG